MIKWKSRTLVLAGALAISANALAMQASAKLMGSGGTSVGTVTLTQTPHGVLLKATLSGLAPGGHGFHVHGQGACTPDFKAAGGHFNPLGKGHGITQSGGTHAGDMPNIYAAADGTVVAEVLNSNITLGDGEGSIFDADGSAIIVHAKPDTHGEAAGAGGRVACGVIQK